MAAVDRMHEQSTCPVCGRIVDDGDVVVFDHGDLIHAGCDRVRRWPPLRGVRVSVSRSCEM
jgi:hypothetical protein